MCQSKVPQVGRRRVLGGVEGDAEDLGCSPRRAFDPPELPTPRHLGLVVDVKATEHQRAVRFQRAEAPGGEGGVVEKAISIHASTRAPTVGVSLSVVMTAMMRAFPRGSRSVTLIGEERRFQPDRAIRASAAQLRPQAELRTCRRRPREILHLLDRLGPLLGQTGRGQ